MNTTDTKTPESEKPAGANGAAEEPVAEEVREDAPDDAPEEAATDAPEAAAPAEAASPEAQIADLNDKLLRSLAETENLRRRAQKEREDTAKYAVAGFARDLLSVADNLGRALDALPADAGTGEDGVGGFIEGVRLTERELSTALERHGVQRLEPMGEKFDPNLHEAMFEIPTADAAPGTVVQVIETGYVLNDRLLRAAKVGVARPLPEAEKGEHVDTTA